MNAYRWRVVFMLWFVCFFNYADRQAISSILPLLARDFGFDPVQLGWISSAFAWVYAGMAPLAGIIADRTARKRIIIAACVGWSFFTMATAWCGNLSMFIAVRALTGLGEAFYFPAAMSLISDYHGAETRSRAMSWHQSAVYAGTILGSWVAALLAERSGWRTPFFLFGPIGIGLALVLSTALREPAARGEGRGARDEEECRVSSVEGKGCTSLSVVFLLMAAFLCANFVAMIFLTWTPTFLVSKFHYSIGAAGLNGTVYIHLASAVAVPCAGWLADRLARRWVGGRMLVQGAGLLLGAIFVAMVGRTNDRNTLLLSMTCFGLCKGFYDSGIFASLYDVIEPRWRGTAAGLMNTVGWGGGALGPLFVGFVTKHGGKANAMENMSEAIAMGAGFYLVGAACVLAAMILVNRKRV